MKNVANNWAWCWAFASSTIGEGLSLTSKEPKNFALRSKLCGSILCPKAISTSFDMQYSTSMIYNLTSIMSPLSIEHLRRKHGEKEPQSFSHWCSFDHPGLQSQNDYKVCFSFCECKIESYRACDIPLERYSQDLSNDILQAPKYLKCQFASQEKQNLQLFSDCRAGWSKEPQWENDCVSFLPCFLLVLETKF